MQRRQMFTVVANEAIAYNTYQFTLRGSTEGFAPGQFVNVLVPGFTLRRPLAIAGYNAEGFTMIYKTVGEGTKALAGVQPGEELDILCPLGNGFTLRSGGRALLVGGGVGVAPLYALAQALHRNGTKLVVACGFGTGAEAYLQRELQELSERQGLATLDGTAGQKGLVTDLFAQPGFLENADYFYACGPVAMLKAVSQGLPLAGEVSLEERMACGFGACVGCAIKTQSGMKRVCKDGPVFAKEEMVW
jgi:dihydroorotate dehydrogenase electron transfer subunit